MYTGGANLIDLKMMMGHADISTTEIYTHLDPEHLRRVHAECHPLEQVQELAAVKSLRGGLVNPGDAVIAPG